MRVIVVSSIEWDTDGESVDLPEEVYITRDHIVDSEGLESEASKEELYDSVADILSDNYGWCVAGFCCDLVDIAEDELGAHEAVIR